MYQEMSFISYYFHWSGDEVMNLDHRSRRKWCQEISDIHKRINPSKEGRKEIPLTEMKPTSFYR